MTLSSKLADGTRQVSEHAYALWTEAAMLALLVKENPGIDIQPILLLTSKSAELCRFAQMIYALACGDGARCEERGVPLSADGDGVRRGATGGSRSV